MRTAKNLLVQEGSRKLNQMRASCNFALYKLRLNRFKTQKVRGVDLNRKCTHIQYNSTFLSLWYSTKKHMQVPKNKLELTNKQQLQIPHLHVELMNLLYLSFRMTVICFCNFFFCSSCNNKYKLVRFKSATFTMPVFNVGLYPHSSKLQYTGLLFAQQAIELHEPQWSPHTNVHNFEQELILSGSQKCELEQHFKIV